MFLVAAIAAARAGAPARRLEAAVAGAALLPLVVWLIHGSVDWFWEVPALSGPALGFLGMAAALGARSPAAEAVPRPTRRRRPTRCARRPPRPASAPAPGRPARRLGVAAGAFGVLALLAAVIVLGFPYLSVREVSIAQRPAPERSQPALHALNIAADLNPLSADPGRLAGTIALPDRRYATARAALRPGDLARSRRLVWLAWRGLAASALGDRAQARRDFRTRRTRSTRGKR